MNFNHEGAVNHNIHGGSVNYWPNRFGIAPYAVARQAGETNAYRKPLQPVLGIKERLNAPKFKEHFNQAQLFYNSLAQHEKHVQSAIAFGLGQCDDLLVYQPVSQRLADIDLELAQSVAKMVGSHIPEQAGRPNHGKKATALSQAEFKPATPTIASRRIAMTIADGFDLEILDAVRAAFAAQGTLPFVIAPRRHTIFLTNSERGIMPDHHSEAAHSTV